MIFLIHSEPLFDATDTNSEVIALAALLAAGKRVAGQEVVVCPDITLLAERGEIQGITGHLTGSSVKIYTQYTARAVRALLAFAGVELADPLRVVTLPPKPTTDWLVEQCGAVPAEADLVAAREKLLAVESDDPWRPWYPTIDRDRCTGCRQCVSFCLFGVYRVEDGRVEVVKPRKCKDNCPACARICPVGAIVFPKHPHPPINGGEGESDEPAKLDPTKMLDGDALWTLRRRAEAQRRAREEQ